MTSDRDDKDAGKPRIEWIVGGVSAVLVACLIFFLTYEATVAETKPAKLVAAIERIDNVENGTLVVVAVTNHGDRAAGQVGVQAMLARADQPAAKAIEFDYIAGHAIRRGAFVFEQQDVAPAEIRVNVQGFTDP
jgi:uncharacterized protein (TIGR02588 family)